MKEIIFLLLFTYPGALVQLLRNEFWPQLVRHKEESATIAAARYFLYSAIVAVISILICTWLMPNAQGLAHFAGLLLVGWNAAIYLAVSAVACVFVAWLLPLCSKGFRHLFRIAHEDGGATVWDRVWRDVNEGKINSDSIYTLVGVWRNERLISAGVLTASSSLPDRPQELLLTYTDEAIRAFTNETDRDKYIDYSVACYYDVESDLKIEFFVAKAFYREFIPDFPNEQV